MSMRVHTAQADTVALSILAPDELVNLYGEEFVGLGQALVVEDTGNCEAWVLLGSDNELLRFARDVMATLTTRRR